MTYRVTTAIFALMAAGIIAPSADAAPKRSGEFHALKDCSMYTGGAGSFCTLTSANLPELSGATVFYDQKLTPPNDHFTGGYLDTNVLLDAGDGNWGLGRCTVDFATLAGLCTFFDGTGQLAGFEARVTVTNVDGTNWRWDGTYRFGDAGE